MNREKQLVKDIANKQAQAREQYAKNKSLLGENRVKEKTTGFTASRKKNNPKENEEEI